jgi:hypothetical protein
MSVMESLEKVLEALPDDRLREVLDYAEFLSWREDSIAWRNFGKTQLAKAYGPNEPEYSAVDLKKEAGA